MDVIHVYWYKVNSKQKAHQVLFFMKCRSHHVKLNAKSVRQRLHSSKSPTRATVSLIKIILIRSKDKANTNMNMKDVKRVAQLPDLQYIKVPAHQQRKEMHQLILMINKQNFTNTNILQGTDQEYSQWCYIQAKQSWHQIDQVSSVFLNGS